MAIPKPECLLDGIDTDTAPQGPVPRPIRGMSALPSGIMILVAFSELALIQQVSKRSSHTGVGAWLFGGYFNQWFRFLALLDLVGL